MKQTSKSFILFSIVFLIVGFNLVIGAELKDYDEDEIKEHYSQLNQQLSSGGQLSYTDSRAIVDSIEAQSSTGNSQNAKTLDQYPKVKSALFKSWNIDLPEDYANKISIYRIYADTVTISKVPRDSNTDIMVPSSLIGEEDNFKINEDGNLVLNGAVIQSGLVGDEKIESTTRLSKRVLENGKEVWSVDGQAEIDLTKMEKNIAIMADDALFTLGEKKFMANPPHILIESDKDGNINVQGSFLMDYVDSENVGASIKGSVEYLSTGEVFLGESSSYFKFNNEESNYLIETSKERLQILGSNDESVDGAFMRIGDDKATLENIGSEVKMSIKGEPFNEVNINGVGEEGIVEINKDGVKIKYRPDGRYTTTGDLNDFPQMNQKLADGHELKIMPTENGCSIQKCSDCKEVGKAYERLSEHVRERTKNVLGDNIKLNDATIITEAYITKDNIEVYRAYDSKTLDSETYIVDLDNKLLLYQIGDGNFQEVTLNSNGEVELLEVNNGPITSELIREENIHSKIDSIPDGGFTMTPKVDLRMRGTVLSPLRQKNAGDILIKDPSIKGLNSELARLNSNTGNYEIVASSFPGSIARSKMSMTPLDFDRYTKDKNVEVIPYKYGNGVMTKSGGFDWVITDSKGNQVGKMLSKGWQVDDNVYLYGPTGKKIGAYTSSKDAARAFEGRALYEWYSSKPRTGKHEDGAQTFFDNFLKDK